MKAWRISKASAARRGPPSSTTPRTRPCGEAWPGRPRRTPPVVTPDLAGGCGSSYLIERGPAVISEASPLGGGCFRAAPVAEDRVSRDYYQVVVGFTGMFSP